ncbi:hypothetical protein Lser_V15G03506 [Lactuca serriola]
MLKKVKTMLLDGCNLGESQTEDTNLDMDSLEMCNANKHVSISTITSSSSSIGAIPIHLKFFTSSLPRSLVRLSLVNNNLSTESFPMDFSSLSLLKKLYLDGNPIHSMPNCVRTLPKLEILSMQYCNKLKSVEHPPHTLKKMLLDSHSKSLEKVVFDPKMSPLKLFSFLRNYTLGSYEIEGMMKIQAMVGVEEKVLRSLGWINLLQNKRNGGNNPRESRMQMLYEFGIFSTTYDAQEMPSWFIHRSAGPSISFTIPSSSPNNLLKGINFCFLKTSQVWYERPLILLDHIPVTLMITVRRECWVVLSHWMFGTNEMEGGDHITITVTSSHFILVKECGVSLVYEDDREKKEEDALGYYKSWNHIIGGDLSPFQTTTGQYILDNMRFFSHGIRLSPYHRKFVPDGPDSQAQKEYYWFRALSPRKPDISGRAHKWNLNDRFILRIEASNMVRGNLQGLILHSHEKG